MWFLLHNQQCQSTKEWQHSWQGTACCHDRSETLQQLHGLPCPPALMEHHSPMKMTVFLTWKQHAATTPSWWARNTAVFYRLDAPKHWRINANMNTQCFKMNNYKCNNFYHTSLAFKLPLKKSNEWMDEFVSRAPVKITFVKIYCDLSACNLICDQVLSWSPNFFLSE